MVIPVSFLPPTHYAIPTAIPLPVGIPFGHSACLDFPNPLFREAGGQDHLVVLLTTFYTIWDY